MQIPEFQIVDDNKSILSNFKLLSQNWLDLKKYLQSLSGNFADSLSEDIIQSIVDQIILNINQYKNVIPIYKNQAIGNTTQVNTSNTNYLVKRTNENAFQISKSSDVNTNQWDTCPLIINVHRTDNGDLIYPIISKNVGNGNIPQGAGAFKITFSNPIDFDFTCVFI